jgi:hypothetical protein
MQTADDLMSLSDTDLLKMRDILEAVIVARGLSSKGAPVKAKKLTKALTAEAIARAYNTVFAKLPDKVSSQRIQNSPAFTAVAGDLINWASAYGYLYPYEAVDFGKHLVFCLTRAMLEDTLQRGGQTDGYIFLHQLQLPSLALDRLFPGRMGLLQKDPKEYFRSLGWLSHLEKS